MLWLRFTSSVEYDDYGVMFEDEDLTKLILAPENLEVYVVPMSVVIIRGGSEVNSPFYKCRQKLNNLKFANGSQLEILESFSFARCAIEGTLDMSPCLNLKSINDQSFYYCSKISKIILPPNIENIMYQSFYMCSSLENVAFPKSLLFLGHTCFSNCERLSNITFHEDALLTTLDRGCFMYCNLTSFKITKNVETFEASALTGNPISKVYVDPMNSKYSSSSNENIITNKKCNTIILFCGYGLESYDVPEGIITLGDSSFRLSTITRIKFCSTLETILGYCFFSSSLIDVVLTPNITSISELSFSSSTQLRSIEWSSNVKTISSNIFSGCESLQEFIVPSGVQILGAYVFNECKNIKHIFISNTVMSIGAGCFTNVNKTCNITFENDGYMQVFNGILYSADMKNLIYCMDMSKTEMEVLNTTEKILLNAFVGAKLTRIDFSNANVLLHIGNSALSGNNLTEIIFPSNLNIVGNNALASNSKLISIDFSKCKQLKVIGSGALTGTALKSIDFPESLLHIYDSAFSGLTSLRSVSFYDRNLISIGPKCFYKTSIQSIIIPISTWNISRESFSGSELRTLIFKGTSKIDMIGNYSFANCLYLNRIELAEGVKGIGRSSFEGCSLLTEISFPSSLEIISINAFKDCIRLNNVEIPDDSSLSIIEGLAFDGCVQLQFLNVTDRNEHFYSENGLLYNKDLSEIILYLPASSREEFVVPETVRKIRAYSFQGASNLRIANISLCNVSEIGYMAFRGCINLEKLILPQSLVDVGSMAFENCISLHCGSVIFAHIESLGDRLVSCGIPKEALSPCATEIFSAMHTSGTITATAVMENFMLLDDSK